LIAALCVAAATCRLDKLIAPPQGAFLCVTPVAPDSLMDSAATGSTARRVDVISVLNCGGGELKWNADIKQGSSWVVVRPDSGTAGTGPPVQVIFDPSDLDTGVYRETAIVSSPAVSAALEVPLWFKIHPCRARQITIGDSISDTLTSADCGAPHRLFRFARIYSFLGTANDSVSIEVPASFDAYVALDTSLARPPLAQADDCQGKTGNPCLYYQRLPLNTTYYVEVTSVDSGDTGAFNLRLVHPRQPNKPISLDQRLNDSVTSVPIGGTVNQVNVLLRAVVSDKDLGDSLYLEAEVRPIATAFSGSNVSPGPKVANGSPAWVRATGLTDKTSYHWRVRVGDNTGRFGGWDSLPGATDFIVNVPHPPNPPTSLAQSKPDGTGINIGGTADTDVVVLSATVSDSDPGDQVRLQVEVSPIGTAFTNTPTDSSALVPNGATAQIKAQFGNNTNYHWQARAKDQTGLTSTWTKFGNNAESATDFRIQLAGVPFPPAALAQFQSDGTTGIPVGGDVIQSPSVVLKGQVSDPDVGQPVRMEVEVRLVGTNFLRTPTATSPFVANGATASVTAAGLTNNSNYHWQARAVDSTSRSGAWVSFPLSPTNPETAADFHVAQPPAQLVFTVQPTNAQAGAAIGPAIQVTAQDAAGIVVTSFTGNITMAIGANPGGGSLSGTTTVAASAGVATFSNLSINKVGTGFTLQASSSSLFRTSNTFNITPGPTTQLVFTTQPTSATAGGAITPAIVVTAQDAFFNTTNFSGSVLLAIAANPGTGTLSGTNPVTAVNGVATFPNLSINRPGTGYTLRATSGSLAGTSTGFSITPGPATQLVFTVQPGNSNAGASIAPPVVVTAQDALGNTATSFSGSVTLAIAANPGGGTLSGTNPVGAANGVATFSNLSINRAGNGYTLRASSGTLTSPTSTTFNIIAGPPQLVFTIQPSSTTAGATINGASGGVQVTAKDALGNTVVTFTGGVTVAIGTNPGGGALSGTTNVTAILGVATFPNLSINRPGTGYTLTASAAGATAGTSGPFNITSAPAAQLVFTFPPSNTGAGAAIAPAVQVTAMDALGNPATGFGGLVTITIASNPGGGTLSGTTAVNAASGVAMFSNLHINKAGTGYTLRASSGTLTPATSTTFNITSVATQVVFTVQPGTTTQAGSSIAPALKVTAQDSLGNTVLGFTGNVTVALFDNPGPGILSGTKTQPATAGVATFANLSINKVGNGYTLIATASGLVYDISTPFNIIPGSPTKLVLAQPSSTPVGATISPVQVTVEDAQGNTVTGYGGSVTIGIASGPFGGGFTPASTTTVAASSGVATFSNLSIDLIGTYTLQASSGALTSLTSDPFFIF
jgi:hypothetical protein